MKDWSSKWKGSVQPRKQRKFRRNAPLHVRRRFLSAHLAPALRERYGTRSAVLRKGDQVEIMRGSNKGMRGAVERVDTQRGRIYMDGMKVKKANGSEVMKPVQASNVKITNLNLDDKKRVKAFERKGKGTETKRGRKEAKEMKPGKEGGKK